MKAIPASSTRSRIRAASSTLRSMPLAVIDRLARLAGSQDRQGPVPLRSQNQNHVNVFAPRKHTEAVDRRGPKLDRHLMP